MVDVRDLSIQQPAYQLDKAFYEGVRTARPQYKLLDKWIIPPFNGRGFVVKQGQTFRVIQVKGPQIGDVTFWNLHNPKERFSSLRTWDVEGWFVKVFSRAWSDVPWFRPMATCVDETLDVRREDNRFHHHSVASHCSAEQVEMRSGNAGLNACRLNLLQAIEPFGLEERNLRDNLDVFQKWTFDGGNGKFYGARTESEPGDYIEFYAEMDLIVAVSVCPSGDNSENVFNVYGEVWPLGIEIYDTGILPKEFPRWTDWRSG